MPDPARITLIYDGECPICRSFSRVVRIRDSIGELVLVDARNNSVLRDEISRRGWDLDQGMVLELNDRLYYGGEAVHMLALIGTRAGIFNRLNYRLFGSPRLAAMVYPVFRACRNLLLRLLGKSRINNLEQDNGDIA